MAFCVVLGAVFCAALVPTCNDAMFEERFFSSNPLKLRLLYRLAGSSPPVRMTCVSSALLARLCPSLPEGGESGLLRTAFCVDWDMPAAGVPVDEVRCVDAEGPVEILVDESVLAAARLYRPGDGLTGASPTESERSGMEVESEIDGARLSIGFLASLSSFESGGWPADERLEDPEVDTVESDEEEGCEGWPSRAGLAWLGGGC